MKFTEQKIYKAIMLSFFISLNTTSTNLLAAEFEDEDDEDEDEIILVYAQKRAERIEDVPVATTLLRASQLENAGITNVEGLQRLVPNVSFDNFTNSRNKATYIRGIGTQSFSDGVETSVGTFVDGVVMGRDFMGINEFSDIQQVEVLRGPQGTLFGKNTSAGLIHVITANPTFDEEWKASLSYGDDNEIRANGSYSNALADTVAGRISVYHAERDGITENIFTNEEIDDRYRAGIRGKLLFTPTDNLEILWGLDYQQVDEQCCDATFRSIPVFPAGTPTAYGVLLANGIDPTTIANQRISVANGQTGEDVENYGTSLTVNYDMDNHRLVSITAYRQGDIFEFNNFDAVPVSFVDTIGAESSSKQFTQEFRLESSSKDDLSYTVGFYYFDNNIETSSFFNGVDLVSFGLNPTLAPTSLNSDTEVDYQNYAFFGQTTFSASENLDLTLGLRYSSDEVSATLSRTSDVGPFPAIGPLASDTDESDVSGRFAVEYSFSDNELFYGSYSRGYKGPAIQAEPLFNPAGATTELPVVGPETVDAYEIGFRGLSEGNLRYAVTFFRSNINDLQASSFDAASLGFVLRNVGEAQTEGVEIEGSWQLTDSFTLAGFLAHQDAEIISYPGAACYGGQTAAEGCVGGLQDLSGGVLPNAPENSARLDAIFTWQSGAFTLGYSWKDDVQYAIANSPNTIQEAYGLLNAVVEFDLNDVWTLSAYGHNLADEDYANFIADSLYTTFLGDTTGDTSTIQILGRGSSFGLRINGSF